MGDVLDSVPHRLVVTGPARERLYRRFCAIFRGRADVSVIEDRRRGERRRRRMAFTVERRGRERRVLEPEWVVPPD
jgi:hypothetical protein